MTTPVELPPRQVLKNRATVQICEDCWRAREGPQTQDVYPDRIRSDTREESYCGGCGQITKSGIYRHYLGREVRITVLARVVGGPRDGFRTAIRLSAVTVDLPRLEEPDVYDRYAVATIGLDVRLHYRGEAPP